MNSVLEGCLNDLARRIDERQEWEVQASWERFLDGKLDAGFFTPPARKPSPAGVDWPSVHINDALHDFDAMLLSQFKGVSDALAGGSGAMLCVRCNYGVSIMSSQLGCEVVEMSREQGNLPTSMALGSEEAIRRVVDGGVPDLRAGQGAAVWDCAERFAEVFKRWPVLGRWIELYHPDTQGPMDNAELAWGSEIFVAFYDQEELVDQFLGLMGEHYITFLRKWFRLHPSRTRHGQHWGLMHRGRVMLRDDSLMNLSPAIFERFVRPVEERCLMELGGGAVHYCGRGDHFIAPLSQMRGLTGVNLSQPELNDMATIYRNTVDKGLQILSLPVGWAEKAGRELKGRVHTAKGGRAA